jgi:CHASE3 domain sensor protein
MGVRAPGIAMPGFKRIDAKIYFCLLLLVLVFFPLLAGAFLSLRQVMAKQTELSALSAQSLVLSERLRAEAQTKITLGPLYVLSQNEALLENLRFARAKFRRSLQALKNIANDPAELDILAEISRLGLEQDFLSAPVLELAKSGAPAADIYAYFEREVQTRILALDDKLKQLELKRSGNFLRSNAELERVMTRMIFGLVAILFAAAFFFTLVIFRL